MAAEIKDRVCETTSTTGTGTFALTGARPGYTAFGDAYTESPVDVWYCAENGTQWEAGVGSYDATANTLARAVITASSAGGGGSVDFTTAPRIFNTLTRAALNAETVDYDNSISGLTATKVQAAIDELLARIIALEGGGSGGDPVGLFVEAQSSPVQTEGTPYSFTDPTPTPSFAASDEFAGDGALSGRTLATASGDVTWIDPTGSNYTDAGALVLAQGLSEGGFPLAVWNEEINAPDGMFIETKMNAATLSSVFGFSFNYGFCTISIYVNDPSYDATARVRMDCIGPNGFTEADGTNLPARTDDPNGLISASYSQNRFFSLAGDARDLPIRVECRPNNMQLFIDGTKVLEQVPNFEMRFVSTTGDPHYGANDCVLNMLKSGSEDPIQVAYLRVGAL